LKLEKEIKMTEFETNCYGMTESAIREQYMNSITAKLSSLEMVVMGMLSDSQEMLNTDYFSKDDVRKQLNKAKFVLAEIMDSKRV
jgi:chromosome condensin MukBEF ATPase and DNA-binding subunit MukB